MDEMVKWLFSSLGVGLDEERFELKDLSPLPEMIDFPALNQLPIFLFQFGNGLLIDGQRRRLSEGEVDPHSKVKEHLGRRLTEYIMETYSTGDGGIVIHSLSTLPHPPLSAVPVEIDFNARNLGSGSSVPRLGFGNHDVDSCIFSMYKNMDLSGRCHDSVHSLLEMNARMAERKMTLMKTATDDGTQAVSPALAFFICLLVALMFTSSLALCTRCLGMDSTSVLCSLSVILSTLTFGWVSLVVTLPIFLMCNWLRDNAEEDNDDLNQGMPKPRPSSDDVEDADDFDYVKCPEDDNEEKSVGEDPVVCVGVPIRIV